MQCVCAQARTRARARARARVCVCVCVWGGGGLVFNEQRCWYCLSQVCHKLGESVRRNPLASSAHARGCEHSRARTHLHGCQCTDVYTCAQAGMRVYWAAVAEDMPGVSVEGSAGCRVSRKEMICFE